MIKLIDNLFIYFYLLLLYLYLGYGQRYPTSRNQSTLPVSIPDHRFVPLTERYINHTKSSPQILFGDKADKRNADQIIYTTSGEIGKFYIDSEPKAVKLLKKNTHTLRAILNSQEKPFNIATSTIKDLSSVKLGNLSTSILTERSICSLQSIDKQNKLIGNTPHYTVSPTSFPKLDSSSASMANNYNSTNNSAMNGSGGSSSGGGGSGLNKTSRGNNDSARGGDNGDTYRDDYNNNTGNTKQLKGSSSSSNSKSNYDEVNQDKKTLYLSTLKNLDSYFDNPYRRDLIAATIPPGSEQLQRWTAASNDFCAQSSKQWTLKLRK